MVRIEKRIFALVVLAVILVQTVFTSAPTSVNAAETTTTSIFTDYLPTINEIIDSSGFKHPSVGLTKELLENVRAKVRAQAEPWNTYFNVMLESYAAARNVSSSNQSGSDPAKPGVDYFNSQGVEARFVADGLKSYTQALLYFITGDEVYRANALHIIRIWSQMDPAKYVYYTDACIHAGIPLYRMVMAAEILRYTSCQTETLVWTEKDTIDFTNNLIVPVTETFLHDQNHFMNQHNYPLLGAMAGYIFIGNRDRYNESVEWFTVNSTATDQGFNGSVKQLFRMVTEEQEPGSKVGEGIPVEAHVQHMEMGRDQAHAGGDLMNAAMLNRMILAQGTKVDPVAGTVSTSEDAVGTYEFLNDRILAAANYFWQYMLGYDVTWTPQAYAITGGDPNNGGMGGTIRDTYNFISSSYRGRYGTDICWEFYSYYTYVKNENVAEKAPYLYEAFTKKTKPTTGGWESADAGHDFWLYLPAEAEEDASDWLSQDHSTSTFYEVEDRYTKLDDKTTTVQEGDISFIRVNAAEAGSNIVYLSSGLYTSATYGLRIRTNGIAVLNTLGQSFVLPDTKGEWKYVAIIGAPGDFMELTVTGTSGTTVDIDHINAAAGTQLTPPVFNTGGSDLKIYTYVGASVNVDLSATDAGSVETVTYELQNNLEGTFIDEETGSFSWQPAVAGNFSLVVTANDGTTIAAKNINIIVGSDRTTAVQAITETYDINQVYVEATLKNYQSVYNDTMSMIDSASDVAFDQQLQALRTATEGLALVTPLAKDGTLRWSSVAYWSSWGSAAPNMDDCSNRSGGWYGLALGTAPNLYHIIDFGPDYKISATKFGFQSNIFADRLANSTVYGSNDGETWTRLTPGVTAYTQAYNTLDVDPAYQNMKYRYIKLQMLQPLPDVLYGIVRNFMELQEFRIYGTRYEIGNKIESVSLSSDQSVYGKVSTGDTIKLTIKAKEPIGDVRVKIQGQDATVTTTDNINLIAELITNSDVQTGAVKFTLDYIKQDGADGETIYMTTDNTKLFLVDGSEFIDVPVLATVTASHEQWPGNALSKEQVGYLLFDGNPSTFGDLNNVYGYYTVDFGTGASVKLSEVLLMPRETVPARMLGMVVQGSNDNVNWTDITKPVSGSTAKVWTVLNGGQIVNHNAYRYFRLYNSNSWSGNVAEVEFYGEYEASAANIASKIKSIATPAMDASQITMPRVPSGYSIAIKSTTPEGIIEPDGSINKPAYDTRVSVVFTVTKTSDGTTADTASIITLAPGLIQAPKIDVAKVAVVTASDRQWVPSGGTPLTKEQIGYYLFDGDLNTAGDLNTGRGAYYIIDFGAGASAQLNEIKMMPRTGNVGRANGTIIQGSNDNVTWTNLTSPVIGALTNTWIDIKADKILDLNTYRYIRIYNSNEWFGNLAEVEFYGDFSFDVNSKIVPPDNYTKGSYYLYRKEVDRITEAINEPGADKTALLQQLLAVKGLLVSKGTLLADRITITQPMVTASSSQWASSGSTGTPQQNGWRAFDGDINTATDTINNPSWILVDFGAGNEESIGSVKFYPRSSSPVLIQRMNGAVLQGSVDGINFVDLYTISNISAAQWYTVSITNHTPFRYFRYYSPNGNANVAELELYKPAKDNTLLTLLLDKSASVDLKLYTMAKATALQNAVTEGSIVATKPDATQVEIDIAAANLQSALESLLLKVNVILEPAQPNGQEGWYITPVTVTISPGEYALYSLDEGINWLQYTQPIILDQEGKYSVLYCSEDDIDNINAVTGAAINIDLKAPTVVLSSNGIKLVDGIQFENGQTITLQAQAEDTLSGVDDVMILLDGQEYQANTPIDLAGKIGLHTVTVTVTDNAGNVSSMQNTFEVVTSLNSMQQLLDRYTASGDVTGGMLAQLQEKLNQAVQQMELNSPKKAAKHLEDYVKHLNNPALQENVTEDVKKILASSANYLITMWTI